MNQLFRITAVVCVLLLSGESNAQGPGYLGKHAFVRADFGGMIAFFNPNANNRGGRYYGEKGNQWGCNTTYDVRLGYAISRKHALFADLGYLKTGMILDGITTNSSVSDYSDSHYLFYNITGKSVALGCQWFNLNKGAIAPMGNYIAFSLKKTWLNGDIIDKKTTYANPAYAELGHAPLGISPKKSVYSFTAEIGQHIILSDRVIISLSAISNFSASTKWLASYGYTGYYTDDTNQSAYKRELSARVSGHSIFLFKVGAGILLF